MCKDDTSHGPPKDAGKRKANPSDLRDSLNKRRRELDSEMKSLQIVTAMGGHLDDDEFDYESPFIGQIQMERLLAIFKEPHMTPYEGTTDPKYHLDAFNDLMKFMGINSRARCHCFPITLK